MGAAPEIQASASRWQSRDRPLKLCFVSADYPTLSPGGSGGIGAHSYTLAHAVSDLGHDVSVVAEATQGASLQADGRIRLHAIARGPRRQWKLGRWVPLPWLRWSFAAQRALRRIHTENPIDLVIFPDAYGEAFRFSLDPLLPYVVRFGGPASVVQRWDGRPVPATRARIETWLERTPAARAPLLLCASGAFADHISREWSLDRSRFRIIRNPLNLDRFHPAAPGAVAPSKQVLFVGHLQPLKGLHDLAAAIPQVLQRHPEAEFRIVGNDTRTGPGRTSLRLALDRELRTLGVLERVRFTEPLPQSELVPLYQRCAVFVLPSHNDVYPNAVLEAMGCGRPCVVTSTTGVAELVKESGCGIVVPPSDPPALAAAIGEILSMAVAQRDQMGMRGRRIVERLCATPVIAAQAVDTYREAIDRFNAGLYGAGRNRR
jgi:glycosyltransferase involved in cell wall biosynthesis